MSPTIIARHLAPLRALPALRSAPAPLALQLRQHIRAPRLYSSSSSSSSQQPQEEGSLNSQFFKHFGRPIFKVLLLSVFTYQLAYYFWTRLECDEIMDEMKATITDLETRIEQLEKARN